MTCADEPATELGFRVVDARAMPAHWSRQRGQCHLAIFGQGICHMRVSLSRRALTLATDIILLVLATLAAIVLRENLLLESDRVALMGPYVIATVVAGLLVFPALGLDRMIWRFSALPDYWRVVGSVAVVVPLALVGTFVFDRLDHVARSLPIIQGVLAVAFLVGARVVLRQRYVDRQVRRELEGSKPLSASASAAFDAPRSTILLVGLSRLTETYLQSVEEFAADRIRVIGLLARRDRHVGRRAGDCEILGVPENIAEVVRGLEPHGVMLDKVVVTCRLEELSDLAREELFALERTSGIEIVILEQQMGLAGTSPSDAQRVHSDRASGRPSPPMRFAFDPSRAHQSASRPYWRVKRGIDILVSATALLLLGPLILVAALAVLASIGSPVLFWQQRPGLGGRPFRVLKFRSMRSAHDSAGRRLSDADRVTAVGSLLRRTRIDELPQLINVLRGDMSLIGPRPLLLSDQSPADRARLLVRPGLTGWAQVIGGRAISADDKAALDVWYVNNASLWLDLQIVARTIPIILLGERSIPAAKVVQAWSDLAQVGIVRQQDVPQNIPCIVPADAAPAPQAARAA